MTDRFRPSIPWKVKMEVILRQDGLCGCGCLERLDTLANTEFDHCPPLALREYDEATRTYIPDANDPGKIVAKVKVHHRNKTNHPRGPHTSVGGDQHLIAKTRNGRDTKFAVVKPELEPSAPLPKTPPTQEWARCRGCGEYVADCVCPPPPVRRPAFQRAR